jgi:cytochrome c peroxidase
LSWFTAGLIALATACSGETATPVDPPAPAPVTPPAPAPDTFPGIAAALNLNVRQLPNYLGPLPPYYLAAVTSTDNTPPENPLTNTGATLGRVLFFDRRLSTNDSVSCASCHSQALGFTDPRQFSTGVTPAVATSTHSMRLGNARFYGGRRFFWNRRAPTLEIQATQPIQNPIEMGFDSAHGGLPALFQKMSALPYYPELFRLVYGDPAITEVRIQRAIAQYVRSMVSTHSRWDDGYAQTFNPADPGRGLGTPIPGFTTEEERGRVLFIMPPQQGGAGCAGCHVPPTYALAANSRSNGLDAGETILFKSPSLKNVAVSGPYMHDGRMATLEAVVEHYSMGIQDGPALDPQLRPNGQPLRLNLPPADKAALVAFMRTLSDPQLAGDPRFTNPFKP